jgi:hypothetical protein
MQVYQTLPPLILLQNIISLIIPVRHAKFYHAGDESLLLDQREMFLGEMREAGAQLFSLNGGGKGGGDSA